MTEVSEEIYKLKKENAELKTKNDYDTLKHRFEKLEVRGKIDELKQRIEINELNAEHEKIMAKTELLRENELLKHQIQILKVHNQSLKEPVVKAALKSDEIQSVLKEVESLKNEALKIGERIANEERAVADAERDRINQFFIGAEKFVEAFENGNADFDDGSYKSWYEAASAMMEEDKQYENEKLVLIRRDMKCYMAYDYLRFGSELDGAIGPTLK